jgi:hypothetical protein
MWRVVYLLGAEVTEVSGERCLNDSVVQGAPESWQVLGEQAASNPLTDLGYPISEFRGDVQIECQGVFYWRCANPNLVGRKVCCFVTPRSPWLRWRKACFLNR